MHEGAPPGRLTRMLLLCVCVRPVTTLTLRYLLLTMGLAIRWRGTWRSYPITGVWEAHLAILPTTITIDV